MEHFTVEVISRNDCRKSFKMLGAPRKANNVSEVVKGINIRNGSILNRLEVSQIRMVCRLESKFFKKGCKCLSTCSMLLSADFLPRV